MPLDRHARRLIEMLRAGAPAEPRELTVSGLRRSMQQLAQVVDVRNVPLARVEERRLSGPGGPLPIRIYTPTSAGRESGGLVFFHGGMGVCGGLDTHDGLCRLLANASACRILAVDYRIAPEHRFPAAVEDAYSATQWLFAHARELGIDAMRIAVGGDSHGGALAAVVSRLARDAGAAAPALQLLFCPVMDLGAETESRKELADGYFFDRRTLDWAISQYCEPGTDLTDPRISPLRARDFTRLPPAHVHTAEFDPMRDEGKAYADALARAGVGVRYVCHSGMIHHFYAMAGAIPYARAAVEAAGAAVGAALER